MELETFRNYSAIQFVKPSSSKTRKQNYTARLREGKRLSVRDTGRFGKPRFPEIGFHRQCIALDLISPICRIDPSSDLCGVRDECDE